MRSSVTDRGARARTALGLLLCWAAIAVDRVDAGRPGELWWTCYVAIAVMAFSAVAGSRRGFAAGLLFHLAVGAPAYGLQVVATGRADPAAIVVHVLPAVLGVLFIRGTAWPTRVLPLAVGMYALCRGAAWLWTEPRHNVNLAHYAWHPLRSAIDNPHVAQLGAMIAMVGLLAVGDQLARRTWRAG